MMRKNGHHQDLYELSKIGKFQTQGADQWFPREKGKWEGLFYGYKVCGGDENVPELDSSDSCIKVSVC